MFNQSLIGKEYDGIPIMMMKSINNSQIDCRKSFSGGIVLSGKRTLFPWFASIIENEIKKLYKQTAIKLAKEKNIKKILMLLIIQKGNIQYLIGASIIANHYNNSDNDDYWITRDEQIFQIY